MGNKVQVQAHQIPSVIGNHELAVTHPKYLNWFNPIARKSLEQSFPLLTDQSLEYISQHTLEIRFLAYDIGAVVDKMKKAGLPEEHARRLW